jgi:hypothetical protein
VDLSGVCWRWSIAKEVTHSTMTILQVSVFHCMTHRTCGCGVDVEAGADGLRAGSGTTWPWQSTDDDASPACLSPTDAVVVNGVRGVHLEYQQRESRAMMGDKAREAGVTVSGEFFSRLATTSASGRQYTVADYGPLQLGPGESVNLVRSHRRSKPRMRAWTVSLRRNVLSVAPRGMYARVPVQCCLLEDRVLVAELVGE